MQLSYQPAFDPFHAVFRFLRMREAVFSDMDLHEDHLKILDFFLLFPFRISNIQFKQAHRGLRKLSKQFDNLRPYGDLPEDRILFGRMNAMQDVALDTLSGKKLIDPAQLELGVVKSTHNEVPSAISSRIAEINAEESGLVDLLTVLACEYPLLGPDGLKRRSGLMEYRYDAA
ncbi:MAG: ABC-three component system middle component 5 [Parvularculaceae bacterium]